VYIQSKILIFFFVHIDCLGDAQNLLTRNSQISNSIDIIFLGDTDCNAENNFTRKCTFETIFFFLYFVHIDSLVDAQKYLFLTLNSRL